MNTFFISDMHFNDESIIRYENRPFKDIEKMNQVIIEKWNNAVKIKDKVFILGDIGKYSSTNSSMLLDAILKKLHGAKYLIAGNHDCVLLNNKIDRQLFEKSFIEIYKYPICFEQFFWLSHEPMYMNSNMPYVNIHGHLHSMYIERSKGEQRHVNVSVEQLNYEPIEFERIKSQLEV